MFSCGRQILAAVRRQHQPFCCRTANLPAGSCSPVRRLLASFPPGPPDAATADDALIEELNKELADVFGEPQGALDERLFPKGSGPECVGVRPKGWEAMEPQGPAAGAKHDPPGLAKGTRSGSGSAAGTAGPAVAAAEGVNSEAGSPVSNASSAVLSHVDSRGQAAMVDVSHKADTQRTAVASAKVLLGKEAFRQVQANENKKGDVLAVARLAGMQGAKHTSNLIPLCHNILIRGVTVDLELDEDSNAVDIRARATCVGPTGVEMEALTAAGVAALTVYDMCKAVSKGIVISNIQLEEKQGGKSGDFQRQ